MEKKTNKLLKKTLLLVGWLGELLRQDIRSIPWDLIPSDVLSKLSLFFFLTQYCNCFELLRMGISETDCSCLEMNNSSSPTDFKERQNYLIDDSLKN